MIRPAIIKDSYSLAKIHKETLSTSFLADLGLNFLNNLYNFLIQQEKVWVYEENNIIKGFISYSSNSAGMMKRFLFNCPICVISLVYKSIINPFTLIKVLETFRAPFNFRISNNSIRLPLGELLSISVSTQSQVSGIGKQLVNVLDEYLSQNKITQYKVVAGEELIGANKFYLKNGFVLATQIKIHGEKKSNVYIKNIAQ